MAEVQNDSALTNTVRLYNDRVVGALGEITNLVADNVQEHTGGRITSVGAKRAMPYVAAGTIAVGGLLAYEWVDKLGRGLVGAVRSVVTGFGYFERIPFIGGVFSEAGWIIDKAGGVAGYGLTAAGSLFAYHLFQPAASKPAGDPKNMPDAGTGAVPQEPLTETMTVYAPGTDKVLTVQQGPVAPKPVEPSHAAAALVAARPELANVSHVGLRRMRAEALAGAHNPVPSPPLAAPVAARIGSTTSTESTLSPSPPTATMVTEQPKPSDSTVLADQRKKHRDDLAAAHNRLADQLGVLMRDENQRYENRRLFLRQVGEFAANSPNGPRNQLIAALNRLGLQPEESQTLVPPPPKLRMTVTPGDSQDTNSVENGVETDFAGQFGALTAFAKKVEGFYGVGFFQVTVNRDGLKEKVRFDDMSVTQRQEFLQAALEHCRNNYKWLVNNCVKTRSVSTGPDCPGYIQTSYDFQENCTSSWPRDYLLWKPAAPEGSNVYNDETGRTGRNRSWKEEYSFLSTLNTDTIVDDLYGNRPVLGNGLTATGGTFDKWQTLLDEHRAQLKQAESSYSGAISLYKDRIRFMQHSFEIIGQRRLAPIAYDRYADRSVDKNSPEYNLRHYITLRDLRTAGEDRGDAQLVRLEGAWAHPDSWVFTVRAISGGKDGQSQIPLDRPVEIDLSKPDSLITMMPYLDQAKAKLQAAQLDEYCSLPTHAQCVLAPAPTTFRTPAGGTPVRQ